MNSNSGHAELIVVITAGAGPIVFITMAAHISGDKDGSNILVEFVRTIYPLEKMLKYW